MKTLQIPVNPSEYFNAPANDRVKIKRDARMKAEREKLDAIEIVDDSGTTIERVSTIQDIADRRYVRGYRATVRSVKGVHDAIENLSAADNYGTLEKDDEKKALVIFVNYAELLWKLRNDARFSIVNVQPVQE